MLSSRARAITLSLLFLVPLVPATASSDLCAGATEPCVLVPLYLQATHEMPGVQAVSALPGDAAATDAGARARGVLAASTRPLDLELALARASTFQVRLESPTPAEHVQGFVSVSLQALDGSRVEIARQDFAAPALRTEPNASILRPILDTSHRAVNGTVTGAADLVGGTPASNALQETERTLCNTPSSPQCDQWHGRYGFGIFRACAAPPSQNLPAALVWTAARTADEAQSGVTGGSVCERSPHAAGAAAAQQVDDAAGPLPRPPWDGLPPFPPLPENGTAPPAHAWRAFTVNATPPEWLPQDAGSFRVPPGFRIRLDVQLSAARAGEVTEPVLFELGRADAPTRFELRTPTPHAFSRFVEGASPILPGAHSGAHVDATQAHDFAFDVPDGADVHVTSLTGSPRLTLYDPDGARTQGSGALAVDGVAGRWTLRVERSSFAPVQSYSFRLSLPTPTHENDGGPIGEGTHAGSLGPGDDADTWTFHAWKAQRFEVALAPPANASYRLVHVAQGSPPLWDVTATPTSLAARPSASGNVTVRVVRDWGEGPYTLALDLDEDGDLSLLPKLTLRAQLPALDPRSPGFVASRLAGYEGAVELTSGGRAYRVHGNGTYTDQGEAFGSLVRDEAGRAIHGTRTAAAVLFAEDGANPLIAPASEVVFGSDGLYAAASDAVLRFREDRTLERIGWNGSTGRFDRLFGPVAAPDGRIYVQAGSHTDAHVVEVDLAQGVLTPVPALRSVSAFDAAGNGYAVLNGTLVERVDGITHERRVVAWADAWIADLAFGGDELFALHASPFGSHGPSISAVDLGMVGFEGFRPTFDPLPPPDLVPVAMEDIVDGVGLAGSPPLPGESHRLRIHVRNDGLGPAGAFDVRAYHRCGAVCMTGWSATARVPGLAAGEATYVELPWHSGGHVGDQDFWLEVDRPWPWGMDPEVAESDETNNRMLAQTYAWVGGQGRLCRTVTDGSPRCIVTHV